MLPHCLQIKWKCLNDQLEHRNFGHIALQIAVNDIFPFSLVQINVDWKVLLIKMSILAKLLAFFFKNQFIYLFRGKKLFRRYSHLILYLYLVSFKSKSNWFSGEKKEPFKMLFLNNFWPSHVVYKTAFWLSEQLCYTNQVS